MKKLLISLGLLAALFVVASAVADKCAAAERITDPRVQVLPWYSASQMVRLAGGNLLSIGDNQVLISSDEGRSWRAQGKICDGKPPGIPPAGTLVVRTQDGAIVIAYLDLSTLAIQWNQVQGEPVGTPKLDVWSARSLDEGKTWIDRHRLFVGYCGAVINMIETRDGHLVLPVPFLATDPARHVAKCYVSSDQGRSWEPSNVIDLGGAGDHDGATEPAVVELSDGRIMMLIRTSLDRFWEAYSDDHGLTWRTVRPSQIGASSAPAGLLRLSSGRIVLAWNRVAPVGGGHYLRRSRPFTHRPASWQRAELSMALTDDDGKTWSKPVVIARDSGIGLSYTSIFEHQPGKLWLSVAVADPPVTLAVNEADFVARPTAAAATPPHPKRQSATIEASVKRTR